ncbi:hypothetical protein [Streptomyces glaucescens]|uniref:Putative secreted protein n=1 Tax=Streptomyces glaucescens TaxID=1907 RepID=A0A089XAG7_STRGA|nr:hypothetical protein [Streptomyces glaucescens]AIS00928.1 putative secreted protein [Streptomyces glaucescens]
MGVFARLLRRSKATGEASNAEAQAGTPSAGSEANEAADTKDPAGAGTGSATETTGAGTGADPAAGVPAPEAGESGSSDGVGIPKQQSAEEAADSEADKGARA